MCKWKPISTVEGEAGEAESPDGFAYYLWGVALRRSGESFEGFNLGTAVDEDLMEVKSRGKSGNLKEFKGTSTENIRKPLYMSQSKKSGFGYIFLSSTVNGRQVLIFMILAANPINPVEEIHHSSK